MKIEPITDEQEFQTSGQHDAVPLPLSPGNAVTVRVEDLVAYTREVPRDERLEEVEFVSLICADPDAPDERYMLSAGADTVFGQGLLRVFGEPEGFAGGDEPPPVRLRRAWRGRLVKVGKVKRSSQSSPHAYHMLVYKPVQAAKA